MTKDQCRAGARLMLAGNLVAEGRARQALKILKGAIIPFLRCISRPDEPAQVQVELPVVDTGTIWVSPNPGDKQ